MWSSRRSLAFDEGHQLRDLREPFVAAGPIAELRAHARAGCLNAGIGQSRISGRGRVVGVLVPSRKGPGADFRGPPPGLTSGGDRRLLRRTLEFERLAIHTFGVKSGEIELCVALPEDASEPVPVKGASLTHVLGLVAGRLDILRINDDPHVAGRGQLANSALQVFTLN